MIAMAIFADLNDDDNGYSFALETTAWVLNLVSAG